MANNIKVLAAVVTVSDTRTEETDKSGLALVSLLELEGFGVSDKIIVSDDFDRIRETLFALSERDDVNLILTTGGTGLAERDNTPEATGSIISKEAPGFSEAIRAETIKGTPMAMLSRGRAGVCNDTLIINLPGSVKGAAESFEVIRPALQHAVNLIGGNTEH